MEEVILRKLDEMFSDLREEIKAKHMQQVHQPKETHQSHCLSTNRRQSLPSQLSSGRRVSMPAKLGPSVRRGSLPFNGDGRRSSLPAFPGRRTSIESPQKRRESTSSRKFSRDSIDLDLVIEDATEADEADSDYCNNSSVIVEEDEEADQQEVLRKNNFLSFDK